MKARDAVIVWTPKEFDPDLCAGTNGKVEVVWYPETRRTRVFTCSTGANGMGWTEKTPEDQLSLILRNMIHMAMVDGMDLRVTHDALCAIYEYRQAMKGFADIPPPFCGWADDGSDDQ